MNRASYSVALGGEGCKTFIAFGVVDAFDELKIDMGFASGFARRKDAASLAALGQLHTSV